MIEINCEGCKNNCCRNPHLTPVLLPSEEEKFRDFSRRIKTIYREMHVLKKKENGNCIFLDDQTMKCTRYLDRPLECRLYPFLLDFSQKEFDAKLDRRFCPHLNSLHASKDKISDLVRKNNFPKEWVDAYISLQDY